MRAMAAVLLVLCMAACHKSAAHVSDSNLLVDATQNTVTITAAGLVLWNGQLISEPQFAAKLRESASMSPEPELHLVPDSNAPYEKSARVLEIIRQSHVTKFGFVGNEAYSSSDAPSD